MLGRFVELCVFLMFLMFLAFLVFLVGPVFFASVGGQMVELMGQQLLGENAAKGALSSNYSLKQIGICFGLIVYVGMIAFFCWVGTLGALTRILTDQVNGLDQDNSTVLIRGLDYYQVQTPAPAPVTPPTPVVEVTPPAAPASPSAKT